MVSCPFDIIRTGLSAILAARNVDPVPTAFLQALNAPGFEPAVTAPLPEDAAILSDLDRALSNLRCTENFRAPVAEAARRVLWYRMLDEAPAEQSLKEGLVVGQIGATAEAPLRIGFFLLSPGLYYPLHQHEAIEIYAPVSGTLGVQHGREGEMRPVHPGEWSVTPSHRLHALETGEDPCLLIYVWTGAVTAPGYWWIRAKDNSWHRTRWERRQDGRWLEVAREAVNEAMLRQAGET